MDGFSLRDWFRVLLYVSLAGYVVLTWLIRRPFARRPVRIPDGLPYPEVVDRLAREIETAYPYLEDKGLNWPAVRNQVVEAARNIGDEQELTRLLTELLGKLDDLHAAVVSPSLVEEFGWHPGLVLRLIGDLGYVQRAPDGPPGDAAESVLGAELVPGTEILLIDGVPVGEAASRFQVTGGPFRPAGRRRPAEKLLLRSRRGSIVQLRYRTPDGREGEVGLNRTHPVCPDSPCSPTSRMLRDGVGYIAFPLFLRAKPRSMPPALVPRPTPRYRSRLSEAMGALRSARALVVDLRGNSGGDLATTTITAARLLPDRRRAGWLVDRKGNKRLSSWFHGFSDAFLGPVALLVDGATASAAEVFAHVLRQTRPRTWVIGRPTAAAVGSPTCVYRYRDLWVFFPGFAFVDRRGYRGLELAGVSPDRAVTWTTEDLRMGRDPDVEEALEFLLDKCSPRVRRPRSPRCGSGLEETH